MGYSASVHGPRMHYSMKTTYKGLAKTRYDMGPCERLAEVTMEDLMLFDSLANFMQPAVDNIVQKRIVSHDRTDSGMRGKRAGIKNEAFPWPGREVLINEFAFW